MDCVSSLNVLNLSLENTRKQDFIEWLHHQPRKLSADKCEQLEDLYIIHCLYPALDDDGKHRTYREIIKIRVTAERDDVVILEIDCQPIASATKALLSFIARSWPETKSAIAEFTKESE